MSTMNIAQSSRTTSGSGLRSSIARRPLVAYFILAFALTWAFTVPMAFSQDIGIGVLPYSLSPALEILLYLLASFIGPTVAALIVTGVTDGRSGVGRLLKRMVQWRVRPRWYVVALVINLLIWLLSYSAVMGQALLAGAVAHWSLLFTTFLPLVAFGLIIPSIAEEPGWRGFALPRLQERYGAFGASMILGLLHGLWHIPGLMTIMLGPLPLANYAPFMVAAMMGTVLYTWVYNNTSGSILIAMLMHASGNAAVGWLTALEQATGLEEPSTGIGGWLVSTGWLNVLSFGLAALLVLAFTSGRLGRSTATRTDDLGIGR